MPANVSDTDLAMVTAGLAKEVDEGSVIRRAEACFTARLNPAKEKTITKVAATPHVRRG
jgi:hypothetical protein